MTAHLGTDDTPLVLHVIPSPLGRGAQRAARLLVDRLDEPGVLRHRLLGLFEGPPEVALDLSLGVAGGSRAAEGFHPGVAFRLRKLVAKLQPAAIVAHGGDPMKYVLPAVLGTGCPVAYCVIGTYTGPATPLHEWRWRRIMARANLVVAVGDEVRQECTARFGVSATRAIMIPNGRDPSQFHPRSPAPEAATDATLIFVGALTLQKEPGRFMEVVDRLRAEGRSFRAEMVGGGPLARELAPKAAEAGVELLGARADVPELLRQSDLLVFTSSPTGEGMPGVLIEAGLSGLPAVSTPVPGAATVIADDHTGLIVDYQVATMVRAVGQLLDDPVRRVAMGAAARARCASMFTLDVMAAQWRAALLDLMDSQDRAGRRTRPALGRRARAFRRWMRARRGNSHS